MRAFLQSVFVGALAAAWLPLIVTTVIALNAPYNADPGWEGHETVLGNVISGILLALSPLIFALAFVVLAFLLIGLPATALLAKFGKESLEAYVGIGLVAGLLLTLAFLSLTDTQELVWIAPLGAFSGAMTARTWWATARETSVNQDFEDRES